jgi:predicted ABC-type ATPase
MPRASSPIIYVLAGPNGAGKTTFARKFLPAAEIVEFLNSDLLAAGLSPLRPEKMASRAARLLLSRWRELLASRQDFGFESTLSGRTYATMLRHAREEGYSIRLCYLWLPDTKLCLRRVRQRVRRGGHDVPEADVRRRFLPSLRNFFTLYLPLADEALLFQADSEPPQIVARWDGTQAAILKPDIYEDIQKQAAPVKTS